MSLVEYDGQFLVDNMRQFEEKLGTGQQDAVNQVKSLTW